MCWMCEMGKITWVGNTALALLPYLQVPHSFVVSQLGLRSPSSATAVYHDVQQDNLCFTKSVTTKQVRET